MTNMPPDPSQILEIPRLDPSENGRWYRSNYPRSPLTDEQVRCLDVLAAADRLYNWTRTGTTRLDGGFRPCGNGVEVRMQHGQFSTFDDDRLTRMVVAAHRHAVRLEVGAFRGMFSIRVHPRRHDGQSWWDRHPTLADLAKRCEQ